MMLADYIGAIEYLNLEHKKIVIHEIFNNTFQKQLYETPTTKSMRPILEGTNDPALAVYELITTELVLIVLDPNRLHSLL